MEARVGSGSAAVETGDWAEALRALRRLLALGECGISEIYDAYLNVAKDVFALRTALIGGVRDGSVSFLRVVSDVPVPFAPAEAWPVASLFEGEAVCAGTSLLCHHIAHEPGLRAHPLYAQGGFETYAAVPIRIGAQVFGVISLFDPDPRAKPFDAEARAFLELLADTLGHAIERHQLETRRRAAEQERREASALFGTAFTNAPIGMALVGLDGHFLQVNEAACRFFGYTEQELLGQDFQSITYGADLHADLDLLEALLSGDTKDYQMEKRYVHRDGAIVWAQLNVALVRFEDGTPRCFISQIQDINPRRALIAELDLRRHELEEANRKLTQLAALDPLTGTLNRRALRQRLDEEMVSAVKAGTPLAFVMVDVDHFKNYNDRHGHLEGDIALKMVAQCLKRTARESDAVGRFGGEEFMLLLPRTGEGDARKVAERLREGIAASKDLRWPLTVSAGVHVFQPDGKVIPVDRPIAQADTALYKAKQNGRNRVEVA
ncbi:diguanylate cyclase [Aquabacter sp. CN5-332]|uniref:sensor domain-containing diguanylate cyclase n=1 Tax=Aquabacter sp. CN5-332 TaxID=3156608 RepID=UPI0032B41628